MPQLEFRVFAKIHFLCTKCYQTHEVSCRYVPLLLSVPSAVICFRQNECSKKVYENFNFNEILTKLLSRRWKIFVCVQEVDARHTYLDVWHTFVRVQEVDSSHTYHKLDVWHTFWSSRNDIYR